MMHEGNKFKSYNYREYAARRIRDEFKQNIPIQDPQKISLLINKGNFELEGLRRQTFLNNMYFDRPLVVEGSQDKKSNQ